MLRRCRQRDRDLRSLYFGPPDFDSTLCAFAYQFPIDHLLQAFKFQAKLVLDQLLVDAMVRQIEVHLAVSGILPELIVPMPLARRCLAERGFNPSVVWAAHLRHVSTWRFRTMCWFAVAIPGRRPDSSEWSERKMSEMHFPVLNPVSSAEGMSPWSTTS
jgi:predicted amidophosphoribosyltransferase